MVSKLAETAKEGIQDYCHARFDCSSRTEKVDKEIQKAESKSQVKRMIAKRIIEERERLKALSDWCGCDIDPGDLV